MTKFLLFGCQGWIGQQFISYIPSSILYEISSMRIQSHHTIEDCIRTIRSSQATHVISFIGRTHGYINEEYISTIDYLEYKGKLKENIQDNLYVPHLLAIACKELDIHFTYLGTGCIFNDDEVSSSFTEKDVPNFFGSSYSIVKGFTDCMMKSYESFVLNVRIRMPISPIPHPRNFITKIVSYEKICSISNSMSVLSELLPYLVQFILDKKVGTIHLTNPGTISHNQILEMYREIVDPHFQWKNFSLSEQNQCLKSDRSNNSLDTLKLQSWIPTVLNIHESIRQCLLEYKKYVQNLLVTGGCGFIGSHFINHVSEKYPYMKIINIDAMYYCASETNIHQKVRDSPNYIFLKGNICDSELIQEILHSYKIDSVIHFAAQSHVQNSFTQSLKYTHDNILGTHTLLEECYKYKKIQRFIHISTDQVYGESLLDETPKMEHSILCPTNPYAATKAGAELIAQSYYHSFRFPLIITRSSNIYGENQYPEKLIPRFIHQILSNQKLTIQGDGHSLRSFLYAKDIVTALELILFQGKIGEIYNIGSEEEYSILEVAKKILLLHDESIEHIDPYLTWIEDRPFNDKRYSITNQKIKELGWNAVYSFDEGLKELWNILSLAQK